MGKNEAGKTAILEALYRLNPIIPEHSEFDVTEDYPRADVEEYQIAVEQEKRSHATPITAVFTLDREEIEPAEEEFGKGVLKAHTVTLERNYGSENLSVDLAVNEGVAVKTLAQNAGLLPEILKKALTLSSLVST